MTTKQARKVALINVADYPRDRYTAYWNIGVDGDDEEGYRWWAEIHSYAPTGWSYDGKVTKERPDVDSIAMPSDAHLARQDAYERMTPEEQAKERDRQDKFRAECAAVHARNPQPVHVHVEHRGVTDTRDEADTAAQTWVLAQMKKYAVSKEFKGERAAERAAKPKGKGKERGYATIGLLLSPLDLIGELLLRLLRPLLALAYAATVRNERLQRIQVNIDLGAGAGLFRIYDSTRPATCGTATTLLAELTFTDPCAPAASGGALTFSAITADASANATGTATWFRNVDSTGTCCVDGNVGTSGSDLNLNSTSIATGQNVAVTSYVITEGNP